MNELLKRYPYTSKKYLLIFFILIMFVFIFFQGKKFNLHKDVTERIRYHALPVAMSVLYHNHPHDYTGLKAIELPFQGTTPIAQLIKDARKQDIQNNRSVYFWVADDKGFEDYIIAAFHLFKPKLQSLYYMWFVILGFSTLLFLCTFYRKMWALSFLCLAYIGIGLAVSTLPLVSLDQDVSAYHVSIYETRYIDVLSFVAMLHIMLAAWCRARLSFFKNMLPLLGQFFILFFLYHCRSSLAWQLVAIGIVCFGILGTTIAQSFKYKLQFSEIKKSCRSPLLIIGLLIFSIFLLAQYKHHTYNRLYFHEMGVRTIWHNALMGLGEADLELANKYQLSVSDYQIAKSVISYAGSTLKCTQDIIDLDPQQLLNSLGGYGIVDWTHYEKCAKNYFLSIVNHNKLKILKLFTFTKPLTTVSYVRDAAIKQPISSMGWHPFSLLNCIFFTIILGLTFTIQKKAYKRLGYIILPVMLSSFIPTVLFYHNILMMGGVFISLSMIIYLFVIFFVIQLVKKINIKKTKHAHLYNHYQEKKLTIVIPAYNEEKRIAVTIREVTEVAKSLLDDYEIIVVDDGSKDNTNLEIQKALVGIEHQSRFIRHQVNQGVGAAFHLGIKLAKFPQLCLVPGDNAFNIEGIKRLFSKCGTLPLVISYRQNMEARTPLRFMLSRIATFFLRIITGFKVKDAHSLYLFPVEMTRNLAIKTSGYGYHIEILSRLLNRHKNFVEVPVILNPKPDASSGVMKPKTLLVLGFTLSKLFGLRLLGRL